MTRLRRPAFAVALLPAVLISGCGNLLGLGDYEIEESADSPSDGSTGGERGSSESCDEGCDDDNDCTDDDCVEGVCFHEALDLGQDCGGGVCDGSMSEPACVQCLDDSPENETDTGCTDEAPTCFDGECGNCSDTASGTDQDLGCSSAQPLCDGGTCVECEEDAHCDDGVSCTNDTCEAGACVSAVVHGNCSDSGDPCTPNLCDPVNDCQATAITPSDLELLRNRSFETGETIWEFDSSGNFTIVSDEASVAAQDGSFVAWMGGVADEVSDVYQWITIPDDATELTVSGYYYIARDGGSVNDPDDIFEGHFYDKDINTLSVPYLPLVDGTEESTAWVRFEKVYTGSELTPLQTGEDILLDFISLNDSDGRLMSFYLDNVSATVKVCQPPE